MVTHSPDMPYTLPCFLCSSPQVDACCSSSSLEGLEVQSASYQYPLSCDECIALPHPFIFLKKGSDLPFLVLFQS